MTYKIETYQPVEDLEQRLLSEVERSSSNKYSAVRSILRDRKEKEIAEYLTTVLSPYRKKYDAVNAGLQEPPAGGVERGSSFHDEWVARSEVYNAMEKETQDTWKLYQTALDKLTLENKEVFEKWINEYKKQGYHVDRIDKLRGLFTDAGGLHLVPVTVFFKKNENRKRNRNRKKSRA